MTTINPQFAELTFPADHLKDKVILITGAGSGIGQAAAKTFAAHGATVILAGKTPKKLELTYDMIVRDGHQEPIIQAIDLQGARPDDYQSLATAVEQEFGRLDGLLHNAGQLGGLSPIELYPTENWHAVMQVHLNAAFMLTQACLPLLKNAPSASIVFTTSTVAQQPRAYWGAYAIAKSGVETLTKILAEECEDTDINVNAINPGATRTRMRANAFPGEDSESLTKPDQLMPVYLALMGDRFEQSGNIINAQQ